ncbi:MAG: YhcG family protein [Kiritimatiellia bacterium]
MNEISPKVFTAVKEIKSAIVRAQARVSANANAEMLSLFFGIGRYVSHKTKTEKWGTGVIDSISVQLQKEMPGLRGFSGKSIRKMRQFFEIWQADVIWTPVASKLESDTIDAEICPPAAAKLERVEPSGLSLSPATLKKPESTIQTTATEFLSISFSHHMEILSGTSTLEERLFYIGESVRNRWGKRQLRESIKRDDFHHRGAMPSNFAATIPDATLARKTLAMFRDEYLLDFVNLDDIEAVSGEDVDERVVEKSIVANIRQFITEFGKDFSFIGNQYRVEAAGHEHFIDLLFFNRELNALVAVELKKGEFKPIYLGQLNLYLQALDDTVKKPHENASVGIILCQSADKPYVEYAIRDYNKPLGVATYRTADEMPENLKRALPPIDELRKQLEISG